MDSPSVAPLRASCRFTRDGAVIDVVVIHRGAVRHLHRRLTLEERAPLVASLLRIASTPAGLAQPEGI